MPTDDPDPYPAAPPGRAEDASAEPGVGAEPGARPRRGASGGPAGRGATPARDTYRTPRYPVFLVTGAVLGLLTGLGLATFGAAPTATGGPGVLGYFAVLGAFFGALLAGTLAVVLESLLNRGRRRRGRS